jgi:hypothetical protein
MLQGFHKLVRYLHDSISPPTDGESDDESA